MGPSRRPPDRRCRSLVTGGAGFIGSNLVDALIEAGDDVTVLDDLSTGRAQNLVGAQSRGCRLATVDVRDPSNVEAVVADLRPHRIFHLAAQIDVRRSVEDPAFDAGVNVQGTINLLEAARRHGTRRFVYTSTGGAIYGDVDVLPTPEDVPAAPMAAYGTSKLCAELYCELYRRLHGLSTATLRLANVYGPRQDPLGEAGVVALFCDRALDGVRPTIYGTGEQTRDFVFVADVVAAQMMLADSEIPGPVNIGTGRETSVLELAGTVAGVATRAGGSFVAKHAAARLGEVQRSCLDIDRARSTLHYEPTVTLAEGLRRTMAWLEDERAASRTVGGR